MSELKLDSRIRLHDGNHMPLFGLGVWAAEPGRETYDAVVHALKTGYRTSTPPKCMEMKKMLEMRLRIRGFQEKRCF